jgi:hypothetical protein
MNLRLKRGTLDPQIHIRRLGRFLLGRDDLRDRAIIGRRRRSGGRVERLVRRGRKSLLRRLVGARCGRAGAGAQRRAKRGA